MDDRTLGLTLRAIRRRRGWRQVDLAQRAGCSQSLVSVVEAGHVSSTTLGQVRSMFAALDARCELAPRWRGADLDRLLDEAHADVVGVAVRRLEAAGWTAWIEVTYSEYGERGSIDVLAIHPAARTILVIEVKTELASIEELGRKLDAKRRLAPALVLRRDGWTPKTVGCAVIFPELPRLRRIVAATPLFRTMLPAGSRELLAWLRAPDGPIWAIWFLSGTSHRNARRVDRRPRRVDRRCRRVGDGGQSSTRAAVSAPDAGGVRG